MNLAVRTYFWQHGHLRRVEDVHKDRTHFFPGPERLSLHRRTVLSNRCLLSTNANIPSSLFINKKQTLLMKILLFTLGLLCRRVSVEPKATFMFRDRVKSDQIYKLIYQAPRTSKIEVSLIDAEGRTMISTRDPYSVLYSKMKSEGEITVSVRNYGKKVVDFGYRCPDVNKEMQGALGPIKDVDQVAELQSVLESIIKTQRLHIRKHEQHATMVAVSRKWITRLLVFETFFFLGVLYFLHKDMIKMFESKRKV